MKSNPAFIVIPIIGLVIFLAASNSDFLFSSHKSSRALEPSSSSSSGVSAAVSSVHSQAPGGNLGRDGIYVSHPQLPPSASRSADADFSASVVKEKSTDSQSSCALRPNTFRDLGTFPFWGKQMNSSFPCPAAGMNNQLTLMLAFWYCFESMEKKRRQKQHQEQKHPLAAGFRWKDITCSPTGGKEGSRRFVVGSSDYVYAWFRWSEVYRVLPRSRITSPFAAAPSTLCLHESYTWKEHPELGRCQSNIGHLYGSQQWWGIRGRLLPHPRYRIFMQCFFSTVASSTFPIAELKEPFITCLKEEKKRQQDDEEQQQNKASATVAKQEGSSDGVQQGGGVAAVPPSGGHVLGIHVRRGDYAHFCKGLVGSSGIRKFRVPPYKWLASKSKVLSGKFPDTCAPSDQLIAKHLKGLMETHEAAIRILFVASNSPSLVDELRKAVAASHPNVRVVSLADAMSLLDSQQQWPAELLSFEEQQHLRERPRVQTLSLTDKVMLDILGLASSNFVVLNRYSTFSQSVIDERVLHGELLDWQSLRGAENVLWW